MLAGVKVEPMAKGRALHGNRPYSRAAMPSPSAPIRPAALVMLMMIIIISMMNSMAIMATVIIEVVPENWTGG
jgi:hypothetical protein